MERDARRGAEDRFHGGAVSFEVRGEDEDPGRREVGVRIEETEEAVVQDLGLAHRRVADVDPDRVVPLRRTIPPLAGLGRPSFGREPEIEHVPLDGGEPPGPVRPDEAPLLRVTGDLHERIDGIAAGPSPGGEELVAFREIPFTGVRAIRPAGRSRAASRCRPSTRGTD